MSKGPEAFRTISEVADDLDLPQHVLRFWETRFPQIRPMKRGGGRRYYRPDDVDLLRGIRHLLYGEGYTIKGVQRILKEQGSKIVIRVGLGDVVPALGAIAADERQSSEAPEDWEEVAAAEFDDDDAVAEEEPPPRAPPPRRVVDRLVPEQRAGSSAALSRDERQRLQGVLAELLDCKRLLDQTR